DCHVRGRLRGRRRVSHAIHGGRGLIAEIALVHGLPLTGLGLLAWAAPRLPVWARCWISFPVGSAGYMALASVWVVVTGRLDPGPLLAATVAVGAVSFVAAFLAGD